jgi:dipeptidyl aminopeptidase/acylaminoacyl peptidase
MVGSPAGRIAAGLLVVLGAWSALAAAAGVTSTMIVEMRHIVSVSVSPDGERAVVGLYHPDPRTNRQELSWVIVPVHGHGTPITVAAGEEIFDPEAPGGLLITQARWSGDGQSFFYLRRDGEQVQLWETSRDGVVTRQVTHSAADLIGLEGSGDPNELIVTLAPERELLRDAEEEEDRAGVLYDDHILGGFPLTQTLPAIDRWRNVRHADNGDWRPTGWTKPSLAIFDIRRHTLDLKVTPAATPGECAANCVENRTYRATAVPVGDVSAAHPGEYAGQYTLRVTLKSSASGAQKKCALAECLGNRISVLGWTPGGQELYYVADSLSFRLGAQLPGRSTIYAWNPRANRVRKIHDAGGRLYMLETPRGLLLSPARLTAQELIVAAEGPDQPPRLEAINLTNGNSRTLFDPNSELRALTSGHATWHTWPTGERYPGRGVVARPDDFREGHRYPLVITTYGCGEGFLRGGSSDNVPEFVAASHGFIAVCVDIPAAEMMVRESDFGPMYPLTCGIIAALIADLDKAGHIDASKVGLSGHSFGANAGAYCLAQSMGKDPTHGIAAAAFRHGSAVERMDWDLIDTAAWRRDPVNGIPGRWNLPDPHHDPSGRWAAISVAERAADINTPVLIQINDTEYLRGFIWWSAMRDAGKTLEMFVFPREPHRLIQPAHQWMNFERQVDWFRFWLKGEEDADPAKRAQYERWEQLRASAHAPAVH